jgi:hypothetical protein
MSDAFIRKTVQDHGRQYIPEILPEDIVRGPIGKCFDWCALEAARLYPKYRYVEGFATARSSGNPIYHAWLSDGINAFDPTWMAINDDGVEFPLPGSYVGVELPLPQVVEFMRSTGYQGVLGNAWRNQELVDNIIRRTYGSVETGA